MTDSRLATQNVEVAVFGSTSDARLVTQNAEVAVFGTTSDARLVAQNVEVAVVVGIEDITQRKQSQATLMPGLRAG